MRGRTSERVMMLIVAAGVPAAWSTAALAQGDPLEQPWAGSQAFAGLAAAGTAWQAVGVQDKGFLGSSVAAAGDVNGDGVGDAVFGAPRVDADGRTQAGEAYIVFGQAGGPPGLGSMSSLDGSNGFTFRGAAANDRLGIAVGAGDINGDGLTDVIIGAAYVRSRTGETYVIFGRSDGFPASLGPDDLDGTNGFRITGMATGIKSGESVAGAGDLNGDGVEDLIIGATDANFVGGRTRGAAYVVFGSRDGFDPVLSLADLDGSNGFELAGSGVDRDLGGAVAAAGDLNGDGLGDAIAGARFAGPGGLANAGAAYVVFGRNDGFPATLSTDELDGANGFALNGAEFDDRAGWAVARAGDLNGDGIDDAAVGAWYAGDLRDEFRAQGHAYVVFGRSTGFPAAVALGDLDGADGFRMEGATATDGAGGSLAGGGDLNGDGFDDLVVGAAGTGYRYACGYCGDYGTPEGSAFVIYGRDSFDAAIELADASAESVVRFDGPTESQMAFSISGMTDFNADGRPDFLLGAIDGTGPISQGPGAGMVIYGRGAIPCPADLDGDGELTLFDFLAFQNLFDAMDPIADFDGDGDFTLFDFLAFQNAFDAGCP